MARYFFRTKSSGEMDWLDRYADVDWSMYLTAESRLFALSIDDEGNPSLTELAVRPAGRVAVIQAQEVCLGDEVVGTCETVFRDATPEAPKPERHLKSVS